MDILSVRSSDVMKKALDGLSARHEAISSNLANVDTPGYKPVKVEFEDKLRRALHQEEVKKMETTGLKVNHLLIADGVMDLRTTDQRHLGAKAVKLSEVHINAYQDDDLIFRTDDNGVDVDTAMTDLAKNSMQYEAVATLQAKHFMLMKEMIKGGGG